MGKIIVKVEVRGGVEFLTGIAGEAEGAAEQLRLKIVIFVRQTRFFWVFAGEIIHGGQRWGEP